ncbi:MAG: SDR family NAD(P)-dependent oxidoreductase, partial [Saprospiraceae bacterium]|nr:SDR family NAD(P)-dependent oxidoreductase [Saprospiraceae bacterium]
MKQQEKTPDIAIIGLSCRFPQAPTPEAFWQIVANGRTVFQATPESRKLHHAPELLAGVRAGFLESPYDFDNARFGIPDAEAIFMDPQQRIMLELAIEAMENAGYPAWSNQPVGVFVGADQLAYQEMISSRWYRRKTADYLLESEAFQQIPPDNRQALQAELEALRALEPLPPHALVGNLANMIPGRIAHELNLKGPAFSVDTACSSSLVAVHLACESLKQGECDTALAGGVNLNLSPSVFQYMSAAGVISPSAKCIPFSRDSDGILLGEGAAMVALKRLDDALRDGDAVWAVIRGASINNDGRSLGLMAPAWKGQLALLQSAYARAGFDPAKITALEAHGTSTRIGDGVELSVIEKFFPLNPENPVSVGSVKSNFGHTLAAAGIAGLLKMTLALHHKKLPPTLHETIDPNKNLAEKGIRIQSELADWVCEGPRCAGVSSFGFGGTNAHLILEEPATAPVFHPAPASLGARKFFQYDFFPQLTPESQTVTTLCWTENPLPLPPPSYEPAHWLVFGFETGQLEQIRAQLSQQGKSSYGVLCQAGSGPSAFTRTGEQDFCIDAGKPDHYRWLLGSLPGAEPLGLLFLADGSPAAEPEQFIEKNLSGLRSLFQAAKQRGQAKIWVATAGAYPVQAAEPVRPEQRALAVLAAGALEENPELRGALIDRSVSEAADLGALLPLLGVAAPGPLALRAGRQFLPALKPVKKNAPDGIALSIKPGGLYLVVGGSSGIGALLAEYFIRQSARKVLVSGARDADSLPPNLTAWMPDRLAYFQSDVSKKAAMAELIDTVYEQYGAPDGIVFAAGSINFGALLNKSQADFERVLLAKIAGASYLSDSLQGRRPGFVYTLSSIAGLSPQWAGGLADYAAANAFLDALAETNYQAAAPWISCSWGIWEHTGMAARLGETARGFAPEDALEIFDDTLAAGRAHVAALPAGQEAQFSPDFSEKKAERLPEKPAPASVPPPVTPAESAAPPAGPSGLDLVQMLKKYIAEAVQTAPGDIDENHSFYQLGLDSLSAVDVAQKIEAHTRQVLHPTILFEHDTIAALAKYLETNRLDAPQPEPPPVETNAADPKRFALIGAQKTFYAQQQFFPEKPCNVLVNAELERPLNPEKLQAALNGLAAQHEALRLAFEMTNEGPRQYVLEKIEAPLECMACADDAALLALENELVNRVFDLEKPPFFRLAYVELPEGRAALLLMMHHLIFDAWSMYVLLKALLRSYEQLDSGETPPASEPDQDFAAYVQFHQQALQHRELEGIKKYWTQALDQAVWS